MSQSLSKTPSGAESPRASSSSGAAAPPPKPSNSFLTKALARPEIGAFLAAVVIYIFFFIVAPPFRDAASFSTVLYASSQVGIVAVAVGMLMIGGEFDLSAGVASITYGLTAALMCYQLSVNMWPGVIVSLILALFVGFINGYLVQKTGIPSFLITLGTFFILQGANLGVTKLLTGSVATPNISDMDGFASLQAIFASTITLGSVGIKVNVLWSILFVSIAQWMLTRTRIGNWIFAVGGNAASARA